MTREQLKNEVFPLNVFSRLESATSVEEVKKILDEVGVEEKYRMNQKRYPKLQITISEEELEKLRHQKIILDSGIVSGIDKQDALTRLLYAITWKNGDLKKLHHIISGIEARNDEERTSGFVFYQFGKHLRDKSEPIIDQHVIRAFGVYMASKDKQVDKKEVVRLKKLSTIRRKDLRIITAYKSWLKNKLKSELKSNEDWRYQVDQVLFAVGKKLKN